jgi:hypothetical protein
MRVMCYKKFYYDKHVDKKDLRRDRGAVESTEPKRKSQKNEEINVCSKTEVCELNYENGARVNRFRACSISATCKPINQWRISG